MPKKQERYFAFTYIINGITTPILGEVIVRTQGNYPSYNFINETVKKKDGIHYRHISIINRYEFRSEQDMIDYMGDQAINVKDAK